MALVNCHRHEREDLLSTCPDCVREMTEADAAFREGQARDTTSHIRTRSRSWLPRQFAEPTWAPEGWRS